MITLRKPQSRTEWFSLGLGLVFVIFPALSLWHGVLSLSWPRTDGVITHSSPTRRYQVGLRYRYFFGGREFSGDTYRFQVFLTRQEERSRDVDAIQGRYPVGERVKVAVDSSDPGRSVLEPGPDGRDGLPLFFGAFLIFVGTGERRKAQALPPVQVGPPPPIAPSYRTAQWLLALGSFAFLYGASELYKGWRSLSWPTAEGKVFYSVANQGSQAETSLWYEYYVNTTRYVADRYRTGGNSTPFDEVAKAAAQRYPVGRSVKVYYNPSNPSEALLEPGIWYGNFVIPGIGFILLFSAWVAKKFVETVYRLPAPRAK